MNLLKRIFGLRTPHSALRTVRLDAPEWENQRREMLARLGQVPEGDGLMTGLIGWQDQRVMALLRECDNRDMTGEQALSLVHRLAETAAFRHELEQTWRQERAKVQQIKKV